MRATRLGLLGVLLLLGWPSSLAADLHSEQIDVSKKNPFSSLRGKKDQADESKARDGKRNPFTALREIEEAAETMEKEQNVSEVKQLTPEQLKKLHEMVLQNLQKRLDFNEDGKMSLSEMVRYAQQRHLQNKHEDAKDTLWRMDMDRDGKLSEKEFSEAWDDLVGADLEFLEALNSTDPNQTAIYNQYAAQLNQTKAAEKKKFETADKDKDGFLNETEIVTMIFPETDPDTHEVQIQDLIDQHDHNKNGKIDLHEYKKAGEHLESYNDTSEELHHDFHGLDLDGDGGLDLHELKPWTDGTFSWKKLLGKVINMFDEDKDEHVTIDELQKAGDILKIESLPNELQELAKYIEL